MEQKNPSLIVLFNIVRDSPLELCLSLVYPYFVIFMLFVLP